MGSDSTSRVHPGGLESRIDYVALPRKLYSSTYAAGRHSDIDLSIRRQGHFAVFAKATTAVEPGEPSARRRAVCYDRSKLSDPVRVSAFEKDLLEVPSPALSVSAKAHQASVVDTMHALLSLHVPKPVVFIREPFLADDT